MRTQQGQAMLFWICLTAILNKGVGGEGGNNKKPTLIFIQTEGGTLGRTPSEGKTSREQDLSTSAGGRDPKPTASARQQVLEDPAQRAGLEAARDAMASESAPSTPPKRREGVISE